MASKGYVQALLNPLDAAVKKVLGPVFDHVLDTNKLGSATKAANFSWFRVTGTTPATALQEFSIEHGLDVVPTWVIPVLDLGTVNAQTVPLSVSRVPDSRRIYLVSSSTSATFTVFVE